MAAGDGGAGLGAVAAVAGVLECVLEDDVFFGEGLRGGGLGWQGLGGVKGGGVWLWGSVGGEGGGEGWGGAEGRVLEDAWVAGSGPGSFGCGESGERYLWAACRSLSALGPWLLAMAQS